MAQVLTQTPVEVMFASASVTDLVHLGRATGPRSFTTLCCPETTFHGNIATEISPKHQRCPRCAVIAKEMAHAASKSKR
jgi:hypothetical protein